MNESINRYDPPTDIYGVMGMEMESTGDWVNYDDHVAAVEALTAERDKALADLQAEREAVKALTAERDLLRSWHCTAERQAPAVRKAAEGGSQ